MSSILNKVKFAIKFVHFILQFRSVVKITRGREALTAGTQKILLARRECSNIYTNIYTMFTQIFIQYLNKYLHNIETNILTRMFKYLHNAAAEGNFLT